MISTRFAPVALALGILTMPSAGEAQQAEKVYRVGYLSAGWASARSVLREKFLEAMHELNYVEGQNLLVTVAMADGKGERLPGLMTDLIQAKVDVVVTTSTRETLAARRASSTIPIVMTLVPDPVEQGLVATLARPGGNVTGLTSVVPGISGKYVQLLQEAVPRAARFVVVGRPNTPFPEIRRELQVAAQQVGVTVSFIEIMGPDEFDLAFARAKKDGAGGIIAPLDNFTFVHRVTFAQLALKHRLPGIYWVRDYVEDGGLMSYGASFGEVGRRAAYFVDRILKGAKPADLPIEQPTKFDLVINLKTAKAMGLMIPQTLLIRADELLE